MENENRFSVVSDEELYLLKSKLERRHARLLEKYTGIMSQDAKNPDIDNMIDELAILKKCMNDCNEELEHRNAEGIPFPQSQMTLEQRKAEFLQVVRFSRAIELKSIIENRNMSLTDLDIQRYINERSNQDIEKERKFLLWRYQQACKILRRYKRK